MKKLLIGLPVAAAVVFAGVPFMTGIVAEKKSKELVDVFNVQSPEYGSVEITNYDRGFLSSQSSYKYVLPPAFQKAAKVEDVEYNCQIDHGVSGVKYACLVAEKGAYKAFLDELLDGKDPLSMTGNISAFGGIDQTIAIDPLSIDFPDGPKVTIAEQIALTTEFDQSSSVYDFNGKIPSVSVESDYAGKEGLFDVSDITLGGSVKELRGGLYIGDVNMAGKQLKALDTKGSVTLNDFNIDTSTQESGSTIASSMSIKAKNVEFPNQAGEMDTLADLLLDAGMYGMDTDAMVEYLKVNQEIQKSIALAGDDEAQNQAALASMSSLIPVAEKLLKKGLGLNVKSSFKSGGTNNDVALDLSLINEIKFSQMMGFLFAPDEALKNFRGSLNVDLKKELLEKYPTLAITASSIPFFVQTDDGVTLDMTLDSVLKVNGEETTVAELLSLFR